MSKGSVELRVNKDLWVLKFDFSAMAAYEKATKGDSIMQLMMRIGAAEESGEMPMNLTTLSALMAAGLKKNHPKFGKPAAAETLLYGWLDEAEKPAELQAEILGACVEGCADAYGLTAAKGEAESPED